MTAYYNECDPYAAQWLRNLIAAGLIAPGDVDDRKIEEVRPDDLRGYTQCHFFAGVGGWSAALRLAEWPDERPVWTGSCPCQPFSAAGKQDGIADPRHLWPVWGDLIAECRPAIIFGEQVANAIGHGWIDTVSGELEAQGYACGYMVLGAHSVGAPHIRQRLWFVGMAHGEQSASQQRYGFDLLRRRADTAKQTWMGGGTSWMANGDGAGQPTDSRTVRAQRGHNTGRCSAVAGVGDTNITRRQRPGRPDQQCGQERWEDADRKTDLSGVVIRFDTTGTLHGFWRDADWLYCRDGCWRPVEPGTFPLAHGVPARVGRLRAYGNAIVPQAGAAWVKIVMDCIN